MKTETKPTDQGQPENGAACGRLDAIVSRNIRFSIVPENDIPAFAGYLSGSVKGPEAKIVVNFEALVNSTADKENDITFEELFTTSVVHEMLHAVQELYNREFDEEEVERVLEEAASLFYG